MSFLVKNVGRISCVGWFLQGSSLTVTEKLCAAFFPFVAIFEAFIFAVSGCFECQPMHRPKKLRYEFKDLVRLAQESRCNYEILCLYFVSPLLIFGIWVVFCLFSADLHYLFVCQENNILNFQNWIYKARFRIWWICAVEIAVQFFSLFVCMEFGFLMEFELTKT